MAVTSRVLALVVGASIGAALFLAAQLVLYATGIGATFELLCTGCNASSHPSMTVMAGLFGTVSSAALSAGGGPPVFDAHKVYKVATASSPEGQQDAAWDAYQSLLGTKGAPPGSPGGDLNDAMNKVKAFSTGKLDLGPPPP